jgi:hypothetical protein
MEESNKLGRGSVLHAHVSKLQVGFGPGQTDKNPSEGGKDYEK